MGSREDEALAEMAATQVGAGLARVIVGAFVLVLLVVPALQLVLEPGPALETVGAFTEARSNRDLKARIDDFDTFANDRTVVGRWVRPFVQGVMTRGLGAGNSQVHVGRGGWLYFRPTLRALAGRGALDARRLAARERNEAVQADPRVAIRRFHRDLRRAGIELFVVPIPPKSTLAGPLRSGLPIQHSWRDFTLDLRRHGIHTVDVPRVLWEVEGQRYLRTDTHWRPHAMRAVAARLASRLATEGVPTGAPVAERVQQREGVGDLSTLLDARGVAPEQVEVLVPEGRPAGEPRVLVLGDSFTNIYSDPSLGFGSGAGLVPTLEAHLGRPVDAIVQNAGGARGVREALADEPERLEDILVVVWVFAARELYLGDWEVVPLDLERSESAEGRVPPESVETFEARVTAVGPRPDPDAPYADQVVGLGLEVEGEAVWAYTWGMQGRVPSTASRLRIGQRIVVRGMAWAAAPDEARTASRTAPDSIPGGAPLWWVEVQP